MLERDFDKQTQTIPQPAASAQADDWEEAGEEEVPTVILYIVAGLLLLSFSLYLIVGGGHGHFH